MDLTNLNKDRPSRKSGTNTTGNLSRTKGVDLTTMVYGKVPPQAKDLEAAVLGAIMIEKDAFDAVIEYLRPECFYLDAHQRIFRAMMNLAQRSQPLDSLMVCDQLRKNEDLEDVGGTYAVQKLTVSVVSGANVVPHSQIILQKFIQREVIRVCGEYIGEAYEDSTDVFEMLDQLEKDVLSIGNQHIPSAEMTTDQVLVQTLTHIEKMRENDTEITGIESGFSDLDKITMGFQPGDLVIIAARPSVGKTALMLNLVKSAAKSAKRTGVAVWSLEMPPRPLMVRLLAAESKIMMRKIQSGRLDDDDMKMLYKEGVMKLQGMNVFFDPSMSLNLRQFKAKARRLNKKYGVSMLVIDYLQLMSGDGKGIREQEISGISRGLKQVADELQVTVIALSQLSREVEKRVGKSKIPQLSDLRESGSIEQDADMVIFLYPPTDEEIVKNPELLMVRYARVAKNRNGGLGTIELNFQSSIQLFEKIDGYIGVGSSPGSTWKPVNLKDITEPTQTSLLPDEEDIF